MNIHAPLPRASTLMALALTCVCVLLGPLQAAAQCPAREENPNHSRIEKLARDYVYHIDSENYINQKKSALRLLLGLGGGPVSAYRTVREIMDLRGYLDGQERLREMLAADGFELIDTTRDPLSGLQAHVYRDKLDDGRTHIVFRGSEELMDFVVDLPGIDKQIADIEGIGAVGELQYDRRQEVLAEWASRYPNSTVSGHSLGGALAQIFIAKHPNAVKEGVIFNSPGVTQKLWNDFHKNGGARGRPTIWNYVVMNDIVSKFGGERHLPNRTVAMSGGGVVGGGSNEDGDSDKKPLTDFPPDESGDYFEQERKSTARPHVGSMLQPRSGTDCRELSDQDYQDTRYGHVPYNKDTKFDKTAEFAADLIDFVGGTGGDVLEYLYEFTKQWSEHDIENDSVLERLFQDEEEKLQDDIDDQRWIEWINEIQKRYKEQQNAPAPPSPFDDLPEVYIHRPKGWGIGS